MKDKDLEHAADMAVIELLIERLPIQAENVERDGHLHAARYMRTAVTVLEHLKGLLK